MIYKDNDEAIEAVAILSAHRPGFFVGNMKIISNHKQGLKKVFNE